MLGVTIDTAVFAPPPVNGQREDAYRFVETLLHWKDAMDDGAIGIYRSKFAQEVLIRCDLYPMRPQLKELLTHAGVIEYDANTVGVWAEKLFKGALEIEPILGITDVLVDDLTIIPDVFAALVPVALREEAQRCAVILSLASSFASEQVLRAHAIAVRATHVGTAIQVRAVIEDIEHCRGDLGGLPVAPEHFEASVLVCSSLNEFLLCLDAVRILRLATQDHDIEVAVRLGLYRTFYTRGSPRDWSKLPDFRVGGDFFRSLQEHHVMSGSSLAERLMRCILETICHENLADTHALRTGQEAGKPQRARGNDMAWRRDVDREYHLHYWECDAGIVELARIVVHNDFSIPA